MTTLLQILGVAAVAIVNVRCICVASQMNRKEWDGHPLQFVGHSLGYPLIGGGSLGILLGWPVAQWMLLFGVALWVLSGRRTNPHHWMQ